MHLLVGRFPVNSLCGAILSIFSLAMPACLSSLTTSSLSLPFMRASVWARKLLSRMLWCRAPSLERHVTTNPNTNKDHGTNTNTKTHYANNTNNSTNYTTNRPWAVVGVDWSYEVTGDDPGALVDQLVEGMLPVGACSRGDEVEKKIELMEKERNVSYTYQVPPRQWALCCG